MTKKLLSIVLTAIAVISTLTACTPKEETATQISDEDSVKIQEDFSFINSEIEKAENAKSTATNDAFQQVLTNPDTSMASYYGTEDITVDLPEHSTKTISIRTTGTFTLESTVASVVVIGADGGFTANAKADSIIFKGENIKAELNSPTGTVYISGKNTELTVKDDEVQKIIIGNNTAIIHNLSKKPIELTLMNGTKVTVSKNQTYSAKDNVLTKYQPEK